MKITYKGETAESLKKKSGNFLEEVSKRVLHICKQDKQFSDNNESMEEIDSKIQELKGKIKKQDILIEKSNTMINDISKKNNLLESEIREERGDLLESLGSYI